MSIFKLPHRKGKVKISGPAPEFSITVPASQVRHCSESTEIKTSYNSEILSFRCDTNYARQYITIDLKEFPTFLKDLEKLIVEHQKLEDVVNEVLEREKEL